MLPSFNGRTHMNLIASILLAFFSTSQLANATPPSVSRAFAAAAVAQVSDSTGRYLIGPQDLLKITVLDEAELTNNYRVDSDGYITFPYIGRVLASGLNSGDLEDRIKNLLSPSYIKNPQVRVEIDQYKSQSVMVSGEVRQPGKIPMTGAMTVLEALAAAGSPTPAASSELTIARPKKSGAGADQPDAEIVRVNWKDLQLGKGTDVTLQDGDLLNIAKAQTFFITGQVKNSSSYVLEPGTTVEQAIAMAGGLADRGSDRRISATRSVNGKRVTISLSMSDVVQAGDTITVQQRIF
jgi:polysaccharide export outer membrane protein